MIIGAPYSVTEELLSGEYQVAMVAHGNSHLEKDMDGKDPYDLPKKLGIYKEIDTPNATITTEGIINRIIDNRKT